MNDEKSCIFCYYETFNKEAYPCSRCIHGLKRREIFQPKAPDRPKGYWKKISSLNKSYKKCSNCGTIYYTLDPDYYCSKCGAKMERKDDE